MLIVRNYLNVQSGIQVVSKLCFKPIENYKDHAMSVLHTMIDTHSHLFDEQFDGDLDEVVRRAEAVGVERIILPGIDSGSHERLLRTLGRYPLIMRGAIGLHPTSVNDNDGYLADLEIVERMLEESRTCWVAVGEVGLDLYWSRDFLSRQLEVFTRQVELAVRYDLPLIIHTRDAWDEMLEAMAPWGSVARGVFHSFSGELRHWQQIEQALPGFCIGVSGVVTYKNSALPEILAHVPLSRILLETDSPYLSPVPYRGKRNESCRVEIVAQAIARIKDTSRDEVCDQTTFNARMLFRI